MEDGVDADSPVQKKRCVAQQNKRNMHLHFLSYVDRPLAVRTLTVASVRAILSFKSVLHFLYGH